MDWLQSIDTAIFRFINGGLSNAVGDKVMPFVSGNVLFVPAFIVMAVLMLSIGGARGRVFILMLAVGLTLSDSVVCRAIKQGAGRQRPFVVLSEVRRPDRPNEFPRGPKGTWEDNAPNSLPSSHAANWFAGAMIAFVYFRRSWRFMVPIALLVCFSRIYNGAHYPLDVLAGAILGAGTGVATVLGVDWLWRMVGRKWFPVWWRRFPSLLHPVLVESEEDEPVEQAEVEAQWLRLSYVIVALTFIGRLVYLAGSTIELSEDEAYQWVWSKHLALSYYSKPPLIAYTQFLGTSLWGDTAFGVRFFSPVIGVLISVLVLRFFAREVSARAGFWLVLIVSTTPLLFVGSLLMTVDPLSVLFWTAAMLAGWRAAGERGTTGDWLWVGLWMGLGFLSKYTELFQIPCWAVFFALWPPARKHLRRPGPWLALLVNILCSAPVLIWNAQRHWVTVTHVAERAGSGEKWTPTLRFLIEFLGAELGALNPVYCIAMVIAAIAFWKRHRHDPRLVYFFSMGAPVFILYMLQAFRSRVLPNWIAPGVIPLFCLMVIYFDIRWRLGQRLLREALGAGLIVGVLMVAVCLNTDLVKKATGSYLPVKLDHLHRVRCWSSLAKMCDEIRDEIKTDDRPVFIIGDHYGFTGEMSFYLPEARAAVRDDPLVYCRRTPEPGNQFYFWPGYSNRHGQDAVFFMELTLDQTNLKPIPESLLAEFETVTNLGLRHVLYHGRMIRPMQCIVCRNLR